MSITISRKHLEHTTTKLKDRNIESTTTKVEHSNLHILVSLVHAVCKSSGSRLVHDTANVKACNLSSLFSSLALRVREVSRHCDDSIRNLLSEIILGSFLHLLQNHCRDFLRSIFTSFDINTWVTALVYYSERNTSCFLLTLSVSLTHETLDRIDSILWVCDSLTFSRVTDFTFTVFHEAYYRRSSTLTLAVSDYDWFVTFEHCNT